MTKYPTRCKLCREPSCCTIILPARPIMILRTCRRHTDWIEGDLSGQRLIDAIERSINTNHYCGIWGMDQWDEVGFERFE